MFDAVPVQAWLLLLLAIWAAAPAIYLYQHAAAAPSRRDITSPPPDLSWRTPRKLVINLLIVAALAGVAVFIFTPYARQFANWWGFLPSLLTAIGAGAVSTSVKGLWSGRVQPLMKGFVKEFERETQPKRFWVSIGWNAILGIFLLGGAFMSFEDGRPNNYDAIIQSGIAHIDNGDLDAAAADFTRAHTLEPNDAWSLANRGNVYLLKKDFNRAARDFEAARHIDPDNIVLLRGEAYLSRERGDLKTAVDRLTSILEQEPEDMWSLLMRAEIYWDLGEAEKSAADDVRLQRLRLRQAKENS